LWCDVAGGRAAKCGDEAGEVVSAWSACLEVRGDPGESAFGMLAGQVQLAVYVQHLERGIASDISRIGREEAL
jgi:hypothetical protein